MSFNPFTMMAVLYVTAGLFFAGLKGLSVLPHMPGPSNLNWLRVHLITVGTITQVIFAYLPGILARRFTLPDRTVRETWLQWGLLNAGFVLIMVGLVGTDAWTGSIGATLVFAAVWRLRSCIVQGWTRSGRPRRESVRFFVTAPVYLLVGITMAISLLLGLYGPGGRTGVFEAHVHANVWGFLSLTAAGMLTEVFPVVAGAPLAMPGWNGRIFLLMNTGLAGLILGPYIEVHPITAAGLAVYVAGIIHLAIRLVLTARAAPSARPAAWQMLLAYLWMLVPAFFAPFAMMSGKVDLQAMEAAATQGLVNGWILGMVMGALPRLLRTRGRLLPAEPAASPLDGSWVSVIALNLGVGLVWATALAPAGLPWQVLTISGYGLIAVAWVPFLRRIWPALAASLEPEP